MPINRIALICVHTSPLAPMGGAKTGGMNVYIRELSRELGKQGLLVDIFARSSSELETDIDTSIGENVRVIYLGAGPLLSLSPEEHYDYLSEFTAELMAFATLNSLHFRYHLQSLLAWRLGGGEAQGSLGCSLRPHVPHPRAHEKAH